MATKYGLFAFLSTNVVKISFPININFGFFGL